jgi:hypothetical protein
MISAMKPGFTGPCAQAALLALGLAGLAGNARAEDIAPGTPFDVEVVVFRHGAEPATAVPGAAGEDRPLLSEATPLAPTALRLGGLTSRLQRSAAYRVLLHAGWTVPARGEREARPVPLSPEATRQGLSGGITLYRTRVLHLAVDVSWRDPVSGIPHRLVQVRRVRPGTTHYFDTPAFGVIATLRESAAEGAAN